jgi:hypothetical protein
MSLEIIPDDWPEAYVMGKDILDLARLGVIAMDQANRNGRGTKDTEFARRTFEAMLANSQTPGPELPLKVIS